MGNLARNPRDSNKKNQWISLSRNICFRIVSCRCTSCMCGPLDNSTPHIYSEHPAKHIIQTHPRFLVKNHPSRGYFSECFDGQVSVFFFPRAFSRNSHIAGCFCIYLYFCFRVPFGVCRSLGTCDFQFCKILGPTFALQYSSVCVSWRWFWNTLEIFDYYNRKRLHTPYNVFVANCFSICTAEGKTPELFFSAWPLENTHANGRDLFAHRHIYIYIYISSLTPIP